MTRSMIKRCIDCTALGLPLNRPATPPGPRCATHKRDRKLTTRESAWALRILKNYALLAEEYWAIFRHQGGHCAICNRATGIRKRLSVDHDHSSGLVRGLLCTPCNKMLGHARDESDFFRRASDYLDRPPARAVIGLRVAPIEELKRAQLQG